jgi:hypothetical protein
VKDPGNGTARNDGAGKGSAGNDSATKDREPLLRIVNGAPTEAELAALVSVLASRAPSANSATEGSQPGRSMWSAPWRRLQMPLRARPGGWRYSALPR